MNKLRPVLIKMQELLVVLLKTTLQDMSSPELNEYPRQTEDETIAERTYERTEESC